MDLYSLNEADALIKFYSKILIGSKVSAGERMPLIKYISKEQLLDNSFRVFAVAENLDDFLRVIRDIQNIAEEFNLLLPKDVLKDLNQE